MNPRNASSTSANSGRTPELCQCPALALREDPDIILVGEMRDLETISLALTAAETGHLVFQPCTPAGRRKRLTASSTSFRRHSRTDSRPVCGIRSGHYLQVLLKRRDGRGRVAALEILIATPAVRNLIAKAR